MTAQQPVELVPRGGLLVVHAHPDDETLATGGLLATWAASGEAVTLVTCTRGERGEVIGDTLAHLEGDGPALAVHRALELKAALGALGVRDHVFLDEIMTAEANPASSGDLRYEDSGMAWVGDGPAGSSGHAGNAELVPMAALVAGELEEQAAGLAELLRARRPDIVVTYEPGGGYGHPDHVRAHEITMRAVALATHASATGAAHAPRDVWWTVVPPETLRSARAQLASAVRSGALASGLATVPEPEGPLPVVAAGLYPVAVVLDTRPVLDEVEEALLSHATQVHLVSRLDTPAPGGPDGDGPNLLAGTYALSNDVLVPWLATEFYARGTGWSTGQPVQPAPSVGR